MGVLAAGVGVAAAVAVGAFVVVGRDDGSRGDTPAAADAGHNGKGDGDTTGGSQPALVDRLDATLDPSRPTDRFLLPFPATSQAGSGCPRRVAIRLTVKAPAAQPLRVKVGAGLGVLGEAVAWPKAPAQVEFDPGRACASQSEVAVVVESTEPLQRPVRYTLVRDDTPTGP
jgi:hypothetical protein